MSVDSDHDPKDYTTKSEDDEYLTRVVIDTCARTFYLYSNEGEKKIVNCDTGDEFMNVLTLSLIHI